MFLNHRQRRTGVAARAGKPMRAMAKRPKINAFHLARQPEREDAWSTALQSI